MTQTARLRWLCRRGMKELDQLLLRYLDEALPDADAGRRDAFARLLEHQDPEIYAWITGRADPEDPDIAEIVQHIRRRALS